MQLLSWQRDSICTTLSKPEILPGLEPGDQRYWFPGCWKYYHLRKNESKRLDNRSRIVGFGLHWSCLGIGFYSAGLIATLVVYFIMARLKRLEYRFLVDDIYLEIYMEYDDAFSVSDIAQQAERNGLKIVEVQHGTKGKGFQKALITFRNTQNESRIMS